MARGAISRPASMRRRAGSAALRISSISWIAATMPDLPWCSTGCRDISPTILTASRISTVPRCTNTPTRCRGVISIGTRSSTISAASKWQTSCSPTHCSGSSVTASMRFASMPSRPCCISTTAVPRAAGSPTASADARTWKRSISCGASTPRCSCSVRTRRRSPRNPLHGPWSPGRWIGAGSASATSGTWAGCTIH